jgi:hypothetical protein
MPTGCQRSSSHLKYGCQLGHLTTQEYPKVSKAALALWYLFEELVILGLFHPAVSLHVKNRDIESNVTSSSYKEE